MINARARAAFRAATLLSCAVLVTSHAQAQDLCPPLARLLTGAPQAFVAGHLAPIGDQIWSASPVVPRAVCELWEARAKDADTLRCTVNDHADANSVAGFYEANVAAIDNCLAGLPASGPWERTSSPVANEGLKGPRVIWSHDTDTLRFSISLASYQRTVTNTFYDSFVVEYLKY